MSLKGKTLFISGGSRGMGLSIAWRAARDGISGHGVDVATGRLLPAAELAEKLLDSVRPVLSASGDLDLVSGWLRQVVRDGDGATRQRRAFTESGSLSGVVDQLAARTAPQAVPQQ